MCILITAFIYSSYPYMIFSLFSSLILLKYYFIVVCVSFCHTMIWIFFFFFLAERGRISILKSTQAGETKLLVIVSQGESKWNTYFFLKSTSHTDETETLWERRLPSHSSGSWASMFPQCGQGTMSSPRPLPPSLYWFPDIVPPPTLGQHHGRSTSAVSHSKGYLV